jgi:hypothetical protein
MLNAEWQMLIVRKSSDPQISSTLRFTLHLEALSDSINSSFNMYHSTFPMPLHAQPFGKDIG